MINIMSTVDTEAEKAKVKSVIDQFTQVWDWDFLMEGQPVRSEGQRLTGVLEKRNGNWVFVQFHNSVPVSG